MAAKTKPGATVQLSRGKRGRVPVKTSINLVKIDENKISAKKAIPGVLLVVVLAALFSKYLVADRLAAMSLAANQAASLRTSLDEAMDQISTYGEVEETYAHYTYADMTVAEQDLVDRTRVLEMVGSVLPVSDVDLADSSLTLSELYNHVVENLGRPIAAEDTLRSVKACHARAKERMGVEKPIEVSARAWSVVDNILTVEVTGVSLERLNQLARQMEEFSIVDSCALSTANKKLDRNQQVEGVTGRFTVYLKKPAEEVAGQ